MRSFIYAALAALALASANVYALGDCNGNGACSTETNNHGGQGGDAEAKAFAKSIGINWNDLTSVQKTEVRNYVTNVNKVSQHQGQGQEQSNNSSGNEVSFTQNYEANDSKYAPDSYAPSTAPCVVGVGGSFGNGIFAGSLSTGITDETCRDLEVIRAGVNSADQEMRDGAKKLYEHVLNGRLERYEDKSIPTTVASTPDN